MKSDMEEPESTRPHLPAWRIAAFASPGMLNGVILYPVVAIIPTFYATHAGLSLAAIGTILFAGRFFDAFTDPLIGHLSDITESPIGHRKPWIIAGMALGMVAIYFLFVPGSGIGVPYFAFWFLTLFLAFTMIQLPQGAWGTEISRHYDDRSRISTYMGMASQLGTLTFAIVPLIPAFGNQGYSADVLKAIAVGALIVMPLITLAAVVFGPEGKRAATKRTTVRSTVRALVENKPFQYFIVTNIINGLGYGLSYALMYLYADQYMHLGHRYPWFLGADAVVTILVIPVWLRIMYRFGKHRSWAAGAVLGAIFLCAMMLLEPGDQSFIPFLVLGALRAAAIAGLHVAPVALLGDVIDYDILRTGANRSANYFAFWAMIAKINAGLGGALGFFLIGLFGYTVGEANTEAAVRGLVFTVLGLPALLMLIGGGLLWWFPIDRRRQTVIRRRIEQRAERAARALADEGKAAVDSVV